MPTTPVHIERSACAATPLPDIMSILRIELARQLVDESSSDVYRVSIDCNGERVSIAVDVPSRMSRTYETNLAGAPPNVRSRIVALAIAEIVRELDREAVPAPPPLPPPPPAPPPSPAPQAPEPPVPDHAITPLPPPHTHSGFALAGFAEASTFRFDGAWLFGGGLRFDYAHGRIAAGLDAALLTSSEQYAIGSAQTLLAYASPSIAWHEDWGAVRTRVGAGYGVGFARLAGRATDARAIASTIEGPWSAPYLFVALSLPISDAFHLDARGQVGWVTLPVVGDIAGASSIDLKGLWTSAQLGASWIL